MSEYDDLVERAYESSKKGEINQAIELFEQATKFNEDDVFPYWQLGYLYKEARNYGLARDRFKTAVQIDQKCWVAWGGLGRVYMCDRDWENAEVAFRKRLELRPSSHQYVFLAYVLRNNLKYDESIECCKQAVILDPDFDEPHFHAGLSFTYKGDLDAARESYRKAIALDNQSVSPVRELGFTFLLSGELIQAECLLKDALVLAEDDCLTHLYLGIVYRRLGKTKEATNEFDKGLKLWRFYDADHELIIRFFRYVIFTLTNSIGIGFLSGAEEKARHKI